MVLEWLILVGIDGIDGFILVGIDGFMIDEHVPVLAYFIICLTLASGVIVYVILIGFSIIELAIITSA